MFNNTSFNLMEKSLDALWLKQKVISQNIANDSTPGYKAKTVDFGVVLNTECNARKKQQDKKKTIDFVTTITDNPLTQQTLDGNNVDTEKENVAMADAQLQYQTLLEKMSNEFAMMKTALQR